MKSRWMSRLVSFRYAINGLMSLLRRETNFRIQVIAGMAAVGLGFVFEITNSEWLIIVMFIGLVLSAEAMNTAVEKLCDAVHPRYSPQIKNIKDISAGAVLVISIAAAVTGTIIFWKYLLDFFTSI